MEVAHEQLRIDQLPFEHVTLLSLPVSEDELHPKREKASDA
jgi:hypothetical protein